LLYHKKFNLAGIKHSDIKTVEDLSKIPFTTKKEVKNGITDATHYTEDFVRKTSKKLADYLIKQGLIKTI